MKAGIVIKTLINSDRPSLGLVSLSSRLRDRNLEKKKKCVEGDPKKHWWRGRKRDQKSSQKEGH
jgi:hypothetical protein